MAKKKQKKEQKKGQKKEQKKERLLESPLNFSKENYLLFALGIISIILGFYSLSKGSITLAPILLVLGYCVIIPISIIISLPKWRRKEESSKE